MISRRNFFSLTLMMLVLLFLFQVTQVVREHMNPYDDNTYAKALDIQSQNVWTPMVYEEIPEEEEYVLLVGSRDTALGKNVEQWCTYTKRNLVVLSDLNEYTRDAMPQIVLLDSENLTFPRDLRHLQSISNGGTPLIFCNLPEVSVIRENSGLQELLGISTIVQDEVQVSGIQLYAGFLLGGDVIYEAKTAKEEALQDLDLTMPWYQTFDRTKVYLTGLIPQGTILMESTYYPSLIWRASSDRSVVFAVNGDYMSTGMASGILTAMVAEMSTYSIYPVVNSQNISLINFPGLASENNAEMEAIYARNQDSVFRDVLWPQLTAMAEANNLKYSCLMMPQWDYQDEEEPNADQYTYYLRQLKEQDSEAGMSLEVPSTTTLSEKVAKDDEFYTSLKSKYIFSSAYVTQEELAEESVMTSHLLSSIKTVLTDYDGESPVVSFQEENVTKQSILSNGYIHTYSDDLLLHCMETALGYSSISVDMNRITWPESDTDRWETLSNSLTSNMDTYWKPFRQFQKTTLSEADNHIRSFLALDYSSHMENELITLDVTNLTGDGWFILRTHEQEIVSVENGEYEKLEEGAYLIHTTKEQVKIHLTPQAGTVPIYYLDAQISE